MSGKGGETVEKKRIYFIDNVKIIAIFFVALGHLLMGLYDAGIFTEQTYPETFVSILYLFHVPLFFICSGFIYQRMTVKQDFKDYSKNILKKLLALGIPYVVFVSATYVLKIIFSSSVNSVNSKGLISLLISARTAPYWFLYVLFIFFVLNPIMKNSADAVIRLVIAIALFMVFDYFPPTYLPQYFDHIITVVRYNAVWFVLGMFTAHFRLERYFTKSGGILFVVFVFLILFVINNRYYFRGYNLFFGFLACTGIISFIGKLSDREENPKVLSFLAKYTMPVFLMHTIFAAGVRSVLLKIGITNIIIHLGAGLAASFILPIIAAMVMEKIHLDFLYAPTKYIKIK